MAYRKFYIEDNEPDPSYKFELTQPTGFTLITDESLLKTLWMQKYDEREKNGHDFYNDFRTRLYLEIAAGEITPAEAFAVEAHLKPLKDELITGNWLTAQNVSTNMPLLGIYDQDLKDEIQLGIDTYVTNEY